MNLSSAALLATLALLSGCVSPSGDSTRQKPAFPDPSTLPVISSMPDPLVTFDGHPVQSKTQWQKERRPELRALFTHYMYGPIPPKPPGVRAQIIGEYPDFLGGTATLRLVRIQVPDNGPAIDLMLVIPKSGRNPAPVFLAMNFCGNQALTTDVRVPVTRSWVPEWCKGATNHLATEASRGFQAADWPLTDMVRRGYALAAFYSGDIDPDTGDASTGLYAWAAKGDPARNQPANRGTIAAWAWGFQRCVDYLITDHDIDSKRIAALGHSRNGKTALLAAAFDDRIAMAFPHQAGCGGSAPSRGTNGESVKQINDHFPHWFNANFKQFNDTPARLPIDQNCLVALCAPRPVLFSAAEGDQWANPAGQFQVLQAATPVYRFLSVQGLEAMQMPPLGKLVDSHLGYYIRAGKHSMTADDWRVFMDFADAHFKRSAH